MAQLSDLIITNPDVTKFEELMELVQHVGESGEMFLEFDVKPDYRDTPKNWQWQLEAAFTRGLSFG
jgi:hypothetical protein